MRYARYVHGTEFSAPHPNMKNITSSSALLILGLSFGSVAPLGAATLVYDLTAGGTQTVGGAIFATTSQQTTGTGVIEPFLRLQADGNETGLNSNENGSNVLGATKAGSDWTKDITLGQLGTTVIGGTSYYTFLLDINQTNANPLLSLDTFRLYTRTTSITDGNPDTLAAVSAGATVAYDMDANDAVTFLLNYDLNAGSGSGDLFVYVPVFGAPSNYLYLYTQFGNAGGSYQSNDGFEEWATTKSSGRVPDGGSTLALLGLGLAGVALFRRKY